ncbi:MAG: PIN domain-containing protein [Chloroflexi bacterium]|nr:PIN domain-containing protein [Chloroflexota bacterium]
MLLVDTNVLVAEAVSDDPYARIVGDYLRANPREDLRVPSCAVFEAAQLIARRKGPLAEAAFVRRLAASDVIEEPATADYARAAALMERYADFPLGTVDALIAAMAERLGVTTLLTLDRRHFGAIKPDHCEAFRLVP